MKTVIFKATIGVVFVTYMIVCLCFTLLLKYGEHKRPEKKVPKVTKPPLPHRPGNFSLKSASQFLDGDFLFTDQYPFFQNAHVFVFVGFGFLTTYLKKYGRSSLGFSLLLSSFVILWYLIIDGLIYMEYKKIHLTTWSIIRAELAAATFMITLGAAFGKYRLFQYYLMAFIETPIYAANRYLVEEVIMAADAGGSTMVHLFGACFGLGVSLIHGFRGGPRTYRTIPLVKSSYESDIFAMIGTLFLWVFWPCFNALLTTGVQQTTAIINTYIALAGSTMIAGIFFVFSGPGTGNWKFQMIYIQEATLSAGVIVASTANILPCPSAAFFVGTVGIEVAALSFYFIQAKLTEKLHIHDTRGVFSYHGVPGFLGGIAGTIMVIWATEDIFGNNLYAIYPGMMPYGKARSRGIQAGFQFASIVSSMGLGFAGGLLTGALIILTIPKFQPEECYIDEAHWQTPENE